MVPNMPDYPHPVVGELGENECHHHCHYHCHCQPTATAITWAPPGRWLSCIKGGCARGSAGSFCWQTGLRAERIAEHAKGRALRRETMHWAHTTRSALARSGSTPHRQAGALGGVGPLSAEIGGARARARAGRRRRTRGGRRTARKGSWRARRSPRRKSTRWCCFQEQRACSGRAARTPAVACCHTPTQTLKAPWGLKMHAVFAFEHRRHRGGLAVPRD